MLERRGKCWLIILAIVVLYPIVMHFLLYDSKYGYHEANFELAPESRIPKWINLSGAARPDVSITIHDYLRASGELQCRIIVMGRLPSAKS
jgi:hypothetical protein